MEKNNHKIPLTMQIARKNREKQLATDIHTGKKKRKTKIDDRGRSPLNVKVNYDLLEDWRDRVKIFPGNQEVAMEMMIKDFIKRGGRYIE
jgi:hypothetical protein